MFSNFNENKNQISFDFTQTEIDTELETDNSFKYELKRPAQNTRIYIRVTTGQSTGIQCWAIRWDNFQSHGILILSHEIR